MNILVTGGAGYIGSILTEELLAQGHRVLVLDNLRRGHHAAVAPGAIFLRADLGDSTALDDIFQQHPIEAVMHLAACTSVGQSMTEPGLFFWNNLACGINLIEHMLKHGVKKIISSSTAAVYGEPKELPITENSPTNPVNAYGESKLMFERILGWYSKAYGLESTSLRYFNVAGASKRFGSDHDPETNLIPNVIKVALEHTEHLPVFGTDYNTKDGTCVRDYIHVLDIARAHILALNHLGQNPESQVYNLGNGEGFSVMEVIEAARRITGAAIPIKICPRRAGDPEKLVASCALAKASIGWEPLYPELEDIIDSAWQWQKKHPQGYKVGV